MKEFVIKFATQIYIFSAISPIIVIFLLKDKLYYVATFIFLFAIIYSNLFLNFRFKSFGDEEVVYEFIEIAEPKFVPIYIAYFVVALSINNEDWCLFLLVFISIFVLIQKCKFSFFNPLTLFRFNFYEVNVSNQASANYRIFLISKQSIKNIGQLSHLVRLNDFTFLQKDDKDGNE